MELLSETDDDKESRDHKIISKWIKHFLEFVPFEVNSAFQHMEDEAAGKIEKLDLAEGGTAFMEADGEPDESLPDAH